MNQTIEPTLFTDPQQAVPVGFCRHCGGEIYGTDGECSRCNQEDSHDPA